MDAYTRGSAERPADGGAVAADEKQIEVDHEEEWLYAAIDTELKLLLEIDVYSHRGANPAAAGYMCVQNN